DNGAWPESPDGNGFSLIRIDPAGDRDPNLGIEWRPSIEAGGNPGTSDSIAFSGENSSDLLAYTVPEIDDLTTRINKDGKLVVTVRQKLGADDALIELEQSTDGITWARLTDGDGIELTERTHNGDGTESLEYKIISKDLNNQDPAILFRAAVRLR
ncbi:MAG: hypothetical protein VX407_01500, partial [Verrucomicrobiota bacterium]|nr:hypothetical protein [Verrucomicrobiota bacterium]